MNIISDVLPYILLYNSSGNGVFLDGAISFGTLFLGLFIAIVIILTAYFILKE